MPTGFFLAVAALVLFPASPLRGAFIVCGLAVEGLGLAVAARGHMERRGEPAVTSAGYRDTGAGRGAGRR
jgi:hypothetical protein